MPTPTLHQTLRHLRPLALLSYLRLLSRFTSTITITTTLYLLMIIASTSLTLDDTCEMISDAKVERGGFEFNLASHDFCPFVAGGVDPADEVEVVYAFEGAEVGALNGHVSREQS